MDTALEYRVSYNREGKCVFREIVVGKGVPRALVGAFALVVGPSRLLAVVRALLRF